VTAVSEVVQHRLTDAHRVAQANLATDTVGKLTVVWKHLLKPANLNDYATYLDVMTGLIRANRTTSAQVAAAYYGASRALYVDAPYDPTLFDAIPDEQIMTSLLVTGPVRVKTLIGNGESMETALNRALIASAGAATRHVANGGRETVRGNALADEWATGWRRVTDGNPCSFCAMLAGRGAVYKSATTATGHHTAGRSRKGNPSHGDDRYHDHCGCTVEAVFNARLVKRDRHGR
jgi:hypothetical protein